MRARVKARLRRGGACDKKLGRTMIRRRQRCDDRGGIETPDIERGALWQKKTNPGPRIDEALLEMAQDFWGSILTEAAADKITMRVLAGKTSAAIPKALSPQEIRALREQANMSQGVFAHILNVTTGYVSQLERGAKRPSGPALALLGVIKRKGIQAIL